MARELGPMGENYKEGYFGFDMKFSFLKKIYKTLGADWE